MYMYIYTYIYIYMCIYTIFIYIFIYAYIYIHTYINTYTYTLSISQYERARTSFKSHAGENPEWSCRIRTENKKNLQSQPQSHCVRQIE